MKQSFEERFWSKVDKTSGQGPWGDCWEWKAYRHRKGYGRVTVNGRVRNAQQVSWELANGRSLQPGMQVLHRCDNPPCCNPKHLFEGTNTDNMNDMTRKNRRSRGEKHARSLLRGKEHPNAVLTESTVREIKRLIAAGVSNGDIARRLPVSPSNVWQIATNRTWKHIQIQKEKN